MKVCKKCKEEKSLDRFYKPKNRPNHSNKCMDCINEEDRIKEAKKKPIEIPLPPNTKICIKCSSLKHETAFGKHTKSKDGLKSACKDCRNQENKEYVSNNREAVRDRSKKAYHADIEKSRKQSLDSYYRKHDINKARIAINNKKYWAAKTSDEVYQHGLKHRDRQYAWRKTNTPVRAHESAARRARILNATPDLTQEEKAQIAQFYKTAKTMSVFHEEDYHVDHIIPLTPRKGQVAGKHHPDNLQVIPATINRRKSNKPDYKISQ